MIVALYARVSTDTQTNDNQLLRLTQIAEARGYVIFDKYCDVASGANPRRPELGRMLHDAQYHKFDKILCVKIDRLARSIVNLLEVIQRLDGWGIAIEFVDQPIDTSGAVGRMMLTILGALAEFERELISDRTKAGLQRAKSEGRSAGRPVRSLTSYQIDKARQLVKDNPHISQRELASNFNGISKNTLIKLLKEEGVI